MRLASSALTFITVVLFSSITFAQEPSVSVPRLINITGVFRPADGQPPAAVETVTLAIYADELGGAPLWQETQTVTIDDRGRYSLLLGATSSGGIPPDVFAAGNAHWLGTKFERAGEVEGPRIRLTSVPYALKAANADTLGGRPAADYLLAPSTPSDDARSANTTQKSDVAAPAAERPGTPNFLAKYVSTSDVGDSAVYENAGNVGIGTTTPFDLLHVRFTNTGGNLTGLAVQNLGNTASSYSGMLFYDQNNQLGHFQGFNNVTHEYRINNIARNGVGQSNGSLNFMTGNVSRFFVGADGSVGIRTAKPEPASVEISNALIEGGPTTLNLTSFIPPHFLNLPGTTIVGRTATGSEAAPEEVLPSQEIFSLIGRGYDGTGFAGQGRITMRTSDGWSVDSHPVSMEFYTDLGAPRMSIGPSGNVGVGTTAPVAPLEIFRTGSDAAVVTTGFSSLSQAVPFYLTRASRGTPSFSSPLQSGDLLGMFGAAGRGTTEFSGMLAGMAAIAAENFSDTSQGTFLEFENTPLGATEPSVAVSVLPSGFVGIGTPLTGNNLPTATDRLQVFGDIRVGNSGTNGCVKDFSGGGLVGTCSSDRRLKKDITPFDSVLNQLTRLQPVHYYWRASEFPDRHFGDSQAAGLIAQDVEQVLPELVATDNDGYKAIDYSKLPLLTIQAVKELKAENDELKQEVAELKRLMNELLASSRR
jgi:endosialidase-like protein